MGALEPGHLIVVLVIILIIFGPGKLPRLGKAIGESVRELKRASTDEGHAKPSTGSPGSGAPGLRRCPACGAAVRGDALFCGGCGTRLTSEAGAPITGSAPAATRGERE